MKVSSSESEFVPRAVALSRFLRTENAHKSVCLTYLADQAAHQSPVQTIIWKIIVFSMPEKSREMVMM